MLSRRTFLQGTAAAGGLPLPAPRTLQGAPAGSPTSGIQELVDKLGKAGGLVTLPSGLFLLKQSIRLPGRVSLRGAGPSTILKRCPEASTTLAKPVGKLDLTIHVASARGFEPGMQVALVRKNEGYADDEPDAWRFDWIQPRIVSIAGNALTLADVFEEDVAVEGARLFNYFPALLASRVKEVAVSQLAIEGDGLPGPGEFQCAAVSMIHCDDVRLDDLTVRGWPADGISVQGGRRASVRNCTVQGTRGHGFHPGTGLEDSVFTANRAVDNAWHGFYFCQAVRGTTVSDSLFRGNGRHGIGGVGGGKNVETRDRFDVLHGNHCLENGQAGIELRQTQGQVVSANICRGNGRREAGRWPGILLADSVRTTLQGNVCVDDAEPAKRTQAHGIQETGTSDENALVGNICRENAKAGLVVVGPRTLSSANQA